MLVSMLGILLVFLWYTSGMYRFLLFLVYPHHILCLSHLYADHFLRLLFDFVNVIARQRTCCDCRSCLLWCPCKNDVRFVLTTICFVGSSCFIYVFVFIYVYWCPTRFLYQMMFVSFNSNTTVVTCEAGTANLSGTHEFTPVLVGFVFLDLLFFVWCFVDCCLSFCPFLWSLCCLSSDLMLLITSLVPSNFSFILQISAYNNNVIFIYLLIHTNINT